MMEGVALPLLKHILCNTHGLIIAGRVHLPKDLRRVEIKQGFR